MKKVTLINFFLIYDMNNFLIVLLHIHMYIRSNFLTPKTYFEQENRPF